MMTLVKKTINLERAVLLFVFVISISTFFMSSLKAATVDAALSFNSPPDTILVGDDFDLVARINPGSNTEPGINAIQLDVNFNTNVLQLNSIEASSPFTLLNPATINNTAGTASAVFFITDSEITTISDVAIFSFHAEGSGVDSQISFSATSEAAVNDGIGTKVVATRTPENLTVLSSTSSSSSSSPVYRFWSPVNRSHFYTISRSERDRVIATWPNDWNYEGVAYYAHNNQASETTPVYRFWSPVNRSHFYTISRSERDRVIATWPNDWNYEGVAWYAKIN